MRTAVRNVSNTYHVGLVDDGLVEFLHELLEDGQQRGYGTGRAMKQTWLHLTAKATALRIAGTSCDCWASWKDPWKMSSQK